MSEFKVIATRQSEDDVLFYFAKVHGKHPNGPRAVMHALDYYGVEPVVVQCGNLRVRLTEVHEVGGDGTFYEIATAVVSA
jgi:hypothetical protein